MTRSPLLPATRAWIEYWCYRAIARLAGALPPRAVEPAAAVLGSAGALVLRRRRRLVARHLRRVLGAGADRRTLNRFVPAAFRSYARYWLETFRLPGQPSEALDAMEVTGGEYLEAALAEGRGVVVASPHLARGTPGVRGWPVRGGVP